MAQHPTDIRLPQDLQPKDGRFGAGPSKVDLSGIRALSDQPLYLGTSHRRDPVKQVVSRVRRGLRDLYALPAEYEVVLGLGGATAFWDAATFSLIRHKSRHAVFGEFSSKFATAARMAPHLALPDLVEATPGSYLAPTAAAGIDTYALTHNETSTGVVTPITRPEGAEGVVLVDATSAAGAISVDPDDFDVYYFSAQKAFGSEGGLWVAVMSPEALERIARIAESGRWVPAFLDLQIAVDNSIKDQTYNTPALATLALLARQIEWMQSLGGLQAAAERSRANSDVLYAWAEVSNYATPFVTEPELRSPTVVTVDLDERIAATDVSQALRANGIVDTDGYRKLGRNQIRVATFPAIAADDVVLLTRAIDYVVESMAIG